PAGPIPSRACGPTATSEGGGGGSGWRRPARRGGAGLPPAHGSVSGNEPRRRSLLARPWTHRGDRQGGEATPLRAARRTAAVPAPGRRLERSQRAAHADRRRVARWTDLAVRAGPAERLLHERAAD